MLDSLGFTLNTIKYSDFSENLVKNGQSLFYSYLVSYRLGNCKYSLTA